MFFKKVPKVIPAIGEKWEYFDKGDPFPAKNPPVTILDIKEGWVRYSMSSSLFQDERLPIDTFILVYRKKV